MLNRLLDRLFVWWEPRYYKRAFDRALDSGEPVELDTSRLVRPSTNWVVSTGDLTYTSGGTVSTWTYR